MSNNSDIQISTVHHSDRKETIIMARFDDSQLMPNLSDSVYGRAVKLLVDRYVEDKYEEISAKIDTDAIAKQLVLAVSTALADKTVKAALSPQQQPSQTGVTPAQPDEENR